MVTPTNNMVITKVTTFSPGVYILPDGIRIEGREITLDGNGAVLVGENYKGAGIYFAGCNNVIIKNISVKRYYWGIKAESCNDLTISNCEIKSTNELAANTIFLDIWMQAKNTYGGGIFLKNVNDSHILNNDLSHQMNGLSTYDCNNLLV